MYACGIYIMKVCICHIASYNIQVLQMPYMHIMSMTLPHTSQRTHTTLTFAD
jgi:hypothetical protein